MTPVLIDVNTYTALMEGDPDAVQILEQAPIVGLSVIVLGELLVGFELGTRKKHNLEKLQEFLSRPGVELLPPETDAAERYAEISVALRRAGKPIPTNDMWIAATALAHDLAVYSFDAHFRSVPGLKIVTKFSEL